ncbi:MAG TPA: alpha-amylase family glycosyl hydrolase [Terriglobales bacterium]|nr:alpha-amylase family glycosyl hydrolase [Terriglobales bacterium]
MSEKIEKSLLEIDFAALTARKFTPSPAAWEDQVLYFLLVDRFSDGDEQGGYRDNDGNPVRSGSTPLHTEKPTDKVDYDDWLRVGGTWQGGTINGLKSKLGYLKRLGITALWVSPVFRQVAFEPSYHGYGIQNFLDVDPHFGTRGDLRDFVRAAHDHGIYVILDIVAHHTGNVFTYEPDRYLVHDAATGRTYHDPRWDGKTYPVRGLNDRNGEPSVDQENRRGLEASWPDGAVWPREFQSLGKFRRNGKITNWDYSPEYLEGDMFALKTLNLWAEQEGQSRQISSGLACLVLVYCFWIAYADIDGFRIDAAKHMGVQALRSFCDTIREFAESLGKERFLLVGEIGGGREQAWEVVQQTGLDAALGIEDVPGALERMVCGAGNPHDYFSIFQNWILDDTAQHRWYRNKVVTLVDDHDQIRKGGSKMRFCGDPRHRGLAFNVVATQLTTMGIPCIYYGTEQEFDSGGRPSGLDLVLRENMFGGDFGGKCTRGHHFFDESAPLYQALSRLAHLRQDLLLLRRGRQMLHQISGDGTSFGFPHIMGDKMLAIVSWSRIFIDQEVLIAFSTDPEHTLSVYSTVASRFRSEGDWLKLLFWHAPRVSGSPPADLLVENRGGILAVHMSVPPAGFVIYQAPAGRQSLHLRQSVADQLQQT